VTEEWTEAYDRIMNEKSIPEMARLVYNWLGKGWWLTGHSFNRGGLGIQSYQRSQDTYFEIWWKGLLVYKHRYEYQSYFPPRVLVFRADPIWIEPLKKYAKKAEALKQKHEEKEKAEERVRFTFPRELASTEDQKENTQ